MTDRDLERTDPKRLAEVMDLSTQTGDEALWRADELTAILTHALAAPLEWELSAMDADVATVLAQAAAAGGPALGTFGDLFRHPRPPAELLRLTKRFARRCKSHPDRPLPGRIATILYLLSIATARMRTNARVSKMDDATLRVGLQWALEQPWLDEATRNLVGSHLARLDAEAGGRE